MVAGRVPAPAQPDRLDGRIVVERQRCGWTSDDPLLVEYHDGEWGVPVHDDLRLFELLLLEGAQAGLSWNTVLRKREAYRRAFAGFDPRRVAAYTDADLERLLRDPGIVRNRAKLRSAVNNARRFLDLQEEHGSFAAYAWRFLDGRPVRGERRSVDEVPARSEVSDALSTDLRRRGFSFVGPTICYAFMQATGMVNDHLVTCFRYGEIG